MSDLKKHIVKNSDGSLSIGTTQDVSNILARNKLEADNNLNRTNKDTFGRKIASIPTSIVDAWCKEWGITFVEFTTDPMVKVKIFQRLSDPAYSLLRTDSGRL